MRRVLFHEPLDAPLAAVVAESAIEARPFRPDAWSLASDEIGVLLAGPVLAPALSVPPPAGLGEAGDRIALVELGDTLRRLDPFWSTRLLFSLPTGSPAQHVALAVRSLLRFLEERARAARDRRALVSRTGEIQALVQIGIALAAETDRDRLLETILSRARALTAADAGSLYLVFAGERGETLRFELAQNDSVRLPDESPLLAVADSSIAGFVARRGAVVNLADVRAIPEDAPYRFDAGFDERSGYRTRSVLAVPMSTPDGRTIGVLQLLNRKSRVMPDGATTAFIRSEVVPFDDDNVEIARSLAAQAAVAVENRRLTESIRALFEGFVEASVTAIEQRDPTTSGHSHRVARLTSALAEAADREERGPYASFRIGRDALRELRYAAVLHDFGKVGVREEILGKARKLPPGVFALVRARFDEALLAAAAEIWERAARTGAREAGVAEALEERRRELERAWRVVERSNEPAVLPRETGAEVEALRQLTYRNASGGIVPLVGPEEIICLAVPLGSLTATERQEIESHVTQTFRFLTKIPWTRDLARVPEWAFAHHEKLDGSGYPRKLTADTIPPQVRMLTICDIFDALAARDRPYKRAVPGQRALEILEGEARRGAIDGDLLRIFIEGGIWKT